MLETSAQSLSGIVLAAKALMMASGKSGYVLTHAMVPSKS
jgi:hypothetical protein